MSEYEIIIMLSVIFPVYLEKKSVDLYLNIMGNMGYILQIGTKIKFASEYQIL
jgi:hypothetical protein